VLSAQKVTQATKVPPAQRVTQELLEQKVTPGLLAQKVTQALPDQKATQALPDQKATQALPEQKATLEMQVQQVQLGQPEMRAFMNFKAQRLELLLHQTLGNSVGLQFRRTTYISVAQTSTASSFLCSRTHKVVN
jgi:hypothetical protein